MPAHAKASGIDPVLKELLDRPIAYHRAFVRLGGGLATAVFLSQAFYWHNRSSDKDGWFYKTREAWTDETGLTRREQLNARATLKHLGVLEEKLRGQPARLFYRIEIQRLVAALRVDHSVEDAESFDIERTISVYKDALRNTANLAYQRAVVLGVKVERVDYEEILRRDNAICHICKKQVTRGPGQRAGYLQFDHVIPLAAGGSHTEGNIRCAHSECNGVKGTVVGPSSLPDNGQLEGPTTANKSARYARPSSWSDNGKLIKEIETTTETTTEIPASAKPPDADQKPAFIITKRKRKLKGWKLYAFFRFWEAFNYKHGRAEAADSWLDIPDLTPDLVDEIVTAATEESRRRPAILDRGGTPKWAQGWITARRFEDEALRPKPKKPTTTTSAPVDDEEERRRQTEKFNAEMRNRGRPDLQVTVGLIDRVRGYEMAGVSIEAQHDRRKT